MTKKGKTFALCVAMLLSMAPVSSTVNAQDMSAQQKAPEFFSSLQDIPLMPGLLEITEETLVFDKPEGRIVEATTLMDKGLQQEQVLSFYQATLPQMGWSRSAANHFLRGQEQLYISFDLRDEDKIAKFMIQPML